MNLPTPLRHSPLALRQSRLGNTLAAALTLALALCLAAPLASAGAATASTPMATTSGYTNLTYSSVRLYGTINARGVPTIYAFQYGTTRAYGSQTPLSAGGNATTTTGVSQNLTGLKPLTTYHYRIIANSGGATAQGSDRTFTTPAVPLALAVVGVPNPVVYGNPFVVEGTLTGTGSAGAAITLQSNPFPYTNGFLDTGNPQVTSSSGGFSFPYLGLTQNTQFRVATIATKPIYSPVLSESVAVRVAFHARAMSRGYVRLYGTVAPAQVGALVGFQLLAPGHKSINQGGTVVKAATPSVSSFSRTVRVRPGLYRALIKVTEGLRVSNYSNPVVVR